MGERTPLDSRGRLEFPGKSLELVALPGSFQAATAANELPFEVNGKHT